jgi:FtsP/CotA-like multicopper oxidase with cupredoxin domain
MNPGRLSRRQMLGLAGLAALAAGTGAAGWAISSRESSDGVRPPSGEALLQPTMRSSRDGILQVELVAAAGVRLAGRDTSALGYNGISPGPTLVVRPGDLLRVRLVNELDQHTNLHTHGLHVSPRGNSDNPLVRVAPGEVFDYAIQLPSDHPVGTFWYHPHHHGTAADQVFSGLAGALIVRGGTEPSWSADRVLVITDITLDGGGRVAGVSPMVELAGREGELVLVNGQHQPVISVVAGTTERWRIVNGCVARVLSLRLEGHKLGRIAVDGHFLAAPEEADVVLLAPGNRADVLVRPRQAGVYALLAEPYDRGNLRMMGGPGMGGQVASGPVALAAVRVSGPEGQPPPLPVTLPAVPVRNDPVTARRTLVFGGADMGAVRMGVTIDGRTFAAGRDDWTAVLGTTEEWTLVNASSLDHPFHLHTWPFQVLEVSRGPAPSGVPQDVVLVPARGHVKLRIPFVDYAGRSVYHCHILDHEDLGMMGTIIVRE